MLAYLRCLQQLPLLLLHPAWWQQQRQEYVHQQTANISQWGNVSKTLPCPVAFIHLQSRQHTIGK